MEVLKKITGLGVFVLALVPVAQADECETRRPDDRITLASRQEFQHANLPDGEVQTPQIFSENILEITYLGDRLLGLRASEENEVALVEIAEDGQTHLIRVVETASALWHDMAVDHQGRLFLLAEFYWWNPPSRDFSLIELDPATGFVLDEKGLPFEIYAISTAPNGGLWTLSPSGLRHLDPDTGIFGDPVASLDDFSVSEFATDSAGRLWGFSEGVCSPPCFMFVRFDPETGISEPQALQPTLLLSELAIRRRAAVDAQPEILCLQNNRFRVELTWENSLGERGNGLVTPARGNDTGLFYFFDPANWELMVKVLNGCAINGHFWVFTSAGTNVGYSLSVKDLTLNREKVYLNPVGHLADSVADTSAFSCP